MKSIGQQIFSASTITRAEPRAAYQRVSARDLGLRETWFRDAIFDNPELVIAPCRGAGRVDDEEVWLSWGIEKNFGSGPIDVLLVSSYGRVGLVETKLSYNPQRRREVVAQLLDYALALQDAGRDLLPALPESEDAPDEDDLVDAVGAGKFLLLIAGDALDPRALRLSDAMLSKHLTNEWDLAMIDVNVFGPIAADGSVILVPELLGTVQSDVRQVVRVQIEGESPKARVTVDRIARDATASRAKKLDSVDAFLAQVEAVAPDKLATSQRVVDAFTHHASLAGDRIRFGLESRTANLYALSSTGHRRRFLTLWPDGDLRIIYRYLSGGGSEALAEELRIATRTFVAVGVGAKRATFPLSADSVEEALSLIGRLAGIVAVDQPA